MLQGCDCLLLLLHRPLKFADDRFVLIALLGQLCITIRELRKQAGDLLSQLAILSLQVFCAHV